MKEKIGYLEPEAYTYIDCICGAEVEIHAGERRVVCSNCHRIYRKGYLNKWTWVGKLECPECGGVVDNLFITPDGLKCMCEGCIDANKQIFIEALEELDNMIEVKNETKNRLS